MVLSLSRLTTKVGFTWQMRMPSTLLWVNPPSKVSVERGMTLLVTFFSDHGRSLRSFQASVAFPSGSMVAVI